MPKLIKLLRRNERGMTLIEFLCWLGLMSIISVVAFKTLALQVEHKLRVNATLIYEEINSIDEYFESVKSEEYTTNITENSIELANSKIRVSLEDTKDGVRLVHRELTTNTGEVVIPFNFIDDFEVKPIDTVVFKGTSNGVDMLYRIPVKQTVQVIYNSEPTTNPHLLKEVVTYVFD